MTEILPSAYRIPAVLTASPAWAQRSSCVDVAPTCSRQRSWPFHLPFTFLLWPLLAIVLAAALGIVLGLRIGRHGLRRLRWLAMVPNAVVLCLDGFFLLFFGLGGSR